MKVLVAILLALACTGEINSLANAKNIHAAAAPKSVAPDVDAIVLREFGNLDKNGDGRVSMDELLTAVTQVDHKTSPTPLWRVLEEKQAKARVRGEKMTIGKLGTQLKLFKKIDTTKTGRITLKEFIDYMEKRFDELDVDGSGSLDFTEFMGLYTTHPQEFLDKFLEKKVNVTRFSQALSEWKVPFQHTYTFVISVMICTLVLSIYNGVFIHEIHEEFQKNPKAKVKMGNMQFLCGAGFILMMALTAWSMITLMRRRLNNDPDKRFKLTVDKSVMSWNLMIFVLCMFSTISSEPYYRAALDQSESAQLVSAASNAPLSHSSITIFLAIFVSAVLFFEGADYVTNQTGDVFFIGVMRLVQVNFIVWVTFGIIYRVKRGEFDGVNGVSDAIYLSAIVHTTVGYGDYGIDTGMGRLICGTHALLVQGINFISVMGFVEAMHVTDPGYPGKTTDYVGKGQAHELLAHNLVYVGTGVQMFLAMLTSDSGETPRPFEKGLKKEIYPGISVQLIIQIVMGLVCIFLSLSKANNILVRRIESHGKMYSDDIEVVGKLLVMWSVNLYLFSVDEDTMMRIFVPKTKDHRFVLPYVSFVLLICALLLVSKYVFGKDKPDESCSDLYSVYVVIIMNNALMYFFALVYWLNRRHFGTVDPEEPEPEPTIPPCVVTNATNATNTTSVTNLTPMTPKEARAWNSAAPYKDRLKEQSVDGIFNTAAEMVAKLPEEEGETTNKTTVVVALQSGKPVACDEAVLLSTHNAATTETVYVINTFTDALYFSIITHSTVGFGDINGSPNFVTHQLTLCHAWVVLMFNMCVMVAVLPDKDEHMQDYLNTLTVNDEGKIDEKELSFVNADVSDAMRQEKFGTD